MEHHETTLAAYVERVRAQADALGVVLTGSVARGTERAGSDVDVVLVVTDEAFDAAWAENRISYAERVDATYSGGYVDIKLAGPALLRAAVLRADDPMRASFCGARVVWTRMADLAEVVTEIAALPEEVWDQRAGAMMAQVRLHAGYFLPQAVELGSTHLLHHAAVHAVAAGGRALLALNRTLFQGHKYLEGMLAGLQRIPDGYSAVARELLETPSLQAAGTYLQLLESFHEWSVSREASLSTFVRDNELAWYSGTLPPEYA